MTLVNAETGEIVETMTRVEAEDFVRFMRAAQEQIPRRIIDAYHRRAWVPLGYPSWESMIAAEGLAIRLPRSESDRMILTYSAAGLSTRAIAPVLDISRETARRRLAGDTSVSPQTPATPVAGPASSGMAMQPKPAQDEAADDTAAHGGTEDSTATTSEGETPAIPRPPVVGIDGKTYARPAPRPAAFERSPQQQNSEEFAIRFAGQVVSLLSMQHDHMRQAAVAQWRAGHQSASPAQRDYVTPQNIRAIGAGLLALADEWEQQ